jgi:hypothetical protein
VIALFVSHWLGDRAGIVNENGVNVGGIFGTAVATMGMLMTTAYILAMDTFGPITDNAGGIAEFSRAEAGAREITDRLDAVGNTTKALTKGYAIASASLAAFLLFSAYIDKVNLILRVQGRPILESINSPASTSSSRHSSRRCSSTSSARWRSAPSARRPRRSSSRCVASSARCPGSWTTPSARLRTRRRHHDQGGPQGDDPAGCHWPSRRRSSSGSSSDTRRSPGS